MSTLYIHTLHVSCHLIHLCVWYLFIIKLLFMIWKLLIIHLTWSVNTYTSSINHTHQRPTGRSGWPLIGHKLETGWHDRLQISCCIQSHCDAYSSTYIIYIQIPSGFIYTSTPFFNDQHEIIPLSLISCKFSYLMLWKFAKFMFSDNCLFHEEGVEVLGQKFEIIFQGRKRFLFQYS